MRAVETYVVRVWAPGPDEPGPPGGLRGEVEHPRSGHRQAFTSVDDLAEILRPPPPEADAPLS
jgi:hypothetical protein